MTDATGKLLADNVYWESKSGDDVGPASNDKQFQANRSQLADFAVLNTIVPAHRVVSVPTRMKMAKPGAHINITINSNHIAFFLRAEIAADPNGNEVLPIRYDDNYITVFPHESRTIEATFETSWLSGHTVVATTSPRRSP